MTMPTALFKRVKHGEMPGEIARRHKIALRERRVPIVVFRWQILDEDDAKAMRRYMKGKTRKVQRRRDALLMRREVDAH